MTLPCTGCYSEKAHGLRLLFNLTLELGAAGYKVVTYCFVFFFFVVGVGGEEGEGGFLACPELHATFVFYICFFLKSRGGSLDLGKVGNN
jgi:hypothetical protein